MVACEGVGRRFLRCCSALVVTASLVGVAALAAATAQASTDDIIAESDPDHPTESSGWQAGTCYSDPPCSVATRGEFFEQAAGHPPVGFTQFIVRTRAPGQTPVDELKTVRVDLPPGLTVNPQATPQCSRADFEAEACPPGSAVGESFVTPALLGVVSPLTVPPPVVYNIESPPGMPAWFGFHLLGNEIFLEADVAWESDYHEGFTIHVPETPFAELPGFEGGVIYRNRLVFDGTSGNGTFITTPTTCFGEAQAPSPFLRLYSTWLLAGSVDEEAGPGYSFPESARPPFESRMPPGTSPKECDGIPFEPTIDAEPGTHRTDSPAGASVTVNLPEIQGPGGEEKQSSSHVRSARTTLPLGMGLNPSAANGLVACTDAQFGKGTRNPVACPDASRIGAVSVETPPLPPGSLTGGVYVGQQLSRDPASGSAYRIFVSAESADHGISARLLGKVSADPRTGQLTTTFDDQALGVVPIPGLPQVPFSAFHLDFDDGAQAALTSPPTCGPHATTAELTPWSGNPPATTSDEFTLSSAPADGGCPSTLAARRFAPRLGAGVADPEAGAFGPFRVHITRSDGEQELKGTTVDLPPGLSARLAGVAYCPEAALAEAAAGSGAAEAANPRCPASSLVGSATVLAGSGPEPLRIAGKVFLTGPYDGAPLSLAIATPATAGPFDLGSVVVRVALFLDRQTARVTAVSDPIPHVFGGALLDIRSVVVDLDRPGFSLNPTNCSPTSIAATLRGGGTNPADPAAFSAYPAAVPFRVNGCDALGFRPRLFLRLFGATRRAKNPKLRAVLLARGGDANIGRVAVTLPKSLILDQGSIADVCTRVQFAANACPSDSIYGYARAITPLLDDPLEGPVILRSSDNPLPDLVASLNGQIAIDLVGRTDSVGGRIRNTFDVVPDVPVSKFVLTVRGGRHGLLTNTRPICGRRAPKKLRAVAKLTGQNGKRANQRPKLRRPCRRKKHR